MSGDNPWIAHAAGPAELCDGSIVEIETKDGARYAGRVAGFMRGRWEHSAYLDEGDHIIAYRLVSA